MADGAHYGERADFPHHETFLRHKNLRWLKIGIALDILAIAAFIVVLVQNGFRLAHIGGTWLGYTLGTVGALIILWLTAIGIRKRAMTEGRWSLKAWVSAHLYLGLSLVVIVTLHTGLQFGWNIHTLAYVLMLLVIASGVVGVLAYAYLPERLSEARGEMTKTQILEIIRTLDRRIHEAAQQLDSHQIPIVRLSLDRTLMGGGLWQRMLGSYRRCGNRKAIRRLPRLRRGATAAQADALDKISGFLARKEELLTTARRYARIRAYLEAWLFVHVPATFALLAALTAHIVSVFYFF